MSLNISSLLKKRATLSFIVLLIGWFFFYWPQLYSIIEADTRIWVSFTTLIIIVAVFYLIYERRSLISHTVLISSQIGLAGLFLLSGLFLFSSILDVKLALQYLVLLMLPFIVMTSFGFSVFLILLFPLLLLLFIVPLHNNAIEDKTIPLVLAVIIYIIYARYLKIYKPNTAPELLPATPFWTLESARWLMPTAIAFCLLMSSPWLADNVRSFYPQQIKKIVLRAPLGTGIWKGPYIEKNNAWSPNFPSASATLQVNYYTDAVSSQDKIFVYTAYYDSDRSFDDLVGQNNKLFDVGFWKSISPVTTVSMDFKDRGSLDVYEQELQAGAVTRLVWYWYYVAGVSTIDLALARWLDGVRIISKYSGGSGIIVLSTSVISSTADEARARLKNYLTEMYGSLVILKRPDIVTVKQ